MPKIVLPFYNLNSFPDCGGSIIAAGPSFSGKTSCILDLLAAKQKILDYAICFSYTEKYNKTFEKHIPKEMIHYSLEQPVFNAVINYHKDQFMQNPDLRVAIVLDDVMGSPDFLNWQLVKEMFYQSRHLGIFFIVVTQHLMLIKNCFRNNCTIIFFCKQPSCTTRRSYHTQFFSAIAKYLDFDKIFQFYTSDNRVLVAKFGKDAVSYDAMANLAYYKSNSFRNGQYVRQFRIGSPELWEYLTSQSEPTRGMVAPSVFNTLF